MARPRRDMRGGMDLSRVPETAELLDDITGTVTDPSLTNLTGRTIRVRRWRHIRRPRDYQAGDKHTVFEFIAITEPGEYPLVYRYYGATLHEAAETIAFLKPRMRLSNPKRRKMPSMKCKNPSSGRRSKHYSKPYRTKQGQHGTMYLYEFTLRFSDPGAPEDKARYWGYDADHAIEKLLDNMTHQGWNYRTEYNIVGEPHRVRE